MALTLSTSHQETSGASGEEGHLLGVKSTFLEARDLPAPEVSLRRSVSDSAIGSLNGTSSAGSDQDGAQSSRFWIPSSLSSQTEDAWSGDYQTSLPHDRYEREGRSSRSGSPYSGSSGENIGRAALKSMPGLPGCGPRGHMNISRLKALPAAWGEAPYPRRSSAPPQSRVGGEESLGNQAGIHVLKIFAEVNGEVPIEQLQELAQSGLLSQIPRGNDGELASVGSIYHDTGACSPCTYWFKSACRNSIGCRYCHFVHPGQTGKRVRPSKQTRMRQKQRKAREAALNALNNDGSSNDGKFDTNGKASSEASSSNRKASSSNGKASSSNGKASSSTDEGKDSSNGSSSNGKTSSSYGKASSSTDTGKASSSTGKASSSTDSGKGTPPGSSTADRLSTTDDANNDSGGSSAAGSSERVSKNTKVAKSGVGRGEQRFLVEGSIAHLSAIAGKEPTVARPIEF